MNNTKSTDTNNTTDSKLDFDVALAAWLVKAQAIVTNHWTYTHSGPPQLSVDPNGKRYVRIVRSDASGSDRSVHCFINKSNGDVLKAASWKAPAKHARGNIYTGEMGVTEYGGTYLK